MLREIYVKVIILFSLLMLVEVGVAQTVSLSGKLTGGPESEEVGYAHILIRELELHTSTDYLGRYSFKNLQKGSYTFEVIATGYSSKVFKLNLQEDAVQNIHLNIKSFRLKEITIMARHRKYNGATRTIHKEAMEHIQPNSLGDIFQLLPGKLTRDGNMNQVDQISSRQAGSDNNTALGTAIITNGIPMSNDATLHRVVADQSQRFKNTVNRGVDLRLISTDHLEKVDIMQGIPSAKYGNLTSGVVVTKAKSGSSPLSVRVKADPNVKLYYVGKGFKIPYIGGSLYLGADYTTAQPSVRSTLSNYSRYSTMANYSNTAHLGDMSLNYGLQMSYIGTLDGQKTDQDLEEIINDYRDQYNHISISHNSQLTTSSNWLKSLDFNIGLSYTNDHAIRDMIVSTGGIQPLAISTEEGEYEGEFLPVEYQTKYTLNDQPLSFFTSLSAKSTYGRDNLRGYLDWGLDYSYERNFGRGYEYDISRPPFPQMPMSSRPRAFNVLPSYQRLSSFVENTSNYTLSGHTFNLKTGFRFSGMPKVDARYTKLSGKIFFEPRMNLSYELPTYEWLGKKHRFSFRFGYGRGIKYPTLDILEPTLFYRDFRSAMQFNPNKPKDNYLLITTKKNETKNYDILPNINDKFELEFVYRLGDIRFELVGFYEEDQMGFTYRPSFNPITYNTYKVRKIKGKILKKNLRLKKTKSRLYEYSVPDNGELVRKTGLEYSLSIPKIKAIQTSIEINGAYYKTFYDISKPIMRLPEARIDNKDYQYVGYYGHERANHKSMFNTNFWFNTHVPNYGLVFTTKFQFIWYRIYQDMWYDGVPKYYFGEDMVKKPFLKKDANDPTLKHLVISKPDIYFEPNMTPLQASLDLKVSKDITDNFRVSFFVNRLGFYSPAYYDKYGIYDKIRRGPYFGSELNIKL